MNETTSTPIFDGGPAFPAKHELYVESGMSLRAWLCGHAPAMSHGYKENEAVPNAYGGNDLRAIPDAERHARWRAEYADAQLAILTGRPLSNSQSPQ